MLKSFRYLKPYIWSVILILILVSIRAYFNLLIPKLIGYILDDMLSQTLTEAQKISSIVTNAIWMFVSTVVGIGVIILSGYFESKTAAAYGKSLRDALYNKVQQFSMNEMDKFTTSSLITRTTNDIQSLQGSVAMLLRMAIMAPIMAVGSLIMAYTTSPEISTVLIFTILMVIGSLGTIFLVAMPKFKLIQRLVDRMNLVTRENLSGLRVVRAFNTQNVQIEKSKKVAKDSMDRNIFVNRLFTAMWPTLGFIMQLTTVGMYFVAVYFGFIKPGSTLKPGDLSTLVQYGTSTVMSFMNITMIFIMIPRASISARRIMDVIDSDILIKNPTEPIELTDVKGEVKFDHVSFYYPGSEEPVLKNINFTAKPGQVTAFIGSTGSGKSTLINLVPRFYDPTEGVITVDGIDLKDVNQNDYLQYIGYVPQKGNLFKGTIASNIGFGQEELNMEVVEKAARIAQASDFISKFEHQYSSPITQGGTNVSGGQRQRLSIARAIAKEPKIYIFDDSFSALDYKTDQRLRKALSDEIKDATVLIVAQRINTIRNADQIIVLDKGEVVGIGTHDDLLQSCSVYQEIAESQLSKEELGR
ncbi:MAG TPA: ABC transporter ATP-binding protein [Acholeplasma sp.]|nr:ABC transporter ATP-binding protein [Acholeplasma sp.]